MKLKFNKKLMELFENNLSNFYTSKLNELGGLFQILFNNSIGLLSTFDIKIISETFKFSDIDILFANSIVGILSETVLKSFDPKYTANLVNFGQ